MATLTPSYHTSIFNAQVPPEGPKALAPIRADWSVQSSYDIHLYERMAAQDITLLQGVFFDNSENDAEVSILVGVINQVVKFPANSMGYLPLLVPKNATLTVTDLSGVSDATTALIFYNIPMPAVVWDVADPGSGAYVACPASATTLLGAAGGVGDYVDRLVIVPLTTSPDQVTLNDGATDIVVFQGGAASVSNLVPFIVPWHAESVNGAWGVTTGANVTVLAFGEFSG